MTGEPSQRSSNELQVEAPWKELLGKLRESENWRSVFVVGRVNTGKTTLCRYLGRELSGSSKTAAIDCDPGQTTLGAPTTVALAWEPWRDAPPAALRFVGSTSPARHFLQTLTGVRRLVDRACSEGADKIVLDASGYPDDGAGKEFQFQVLDAVAPEHLVALQRGHELEELLVGFARRAEMRIHRPGVASAVTVRNRDERRAYRERRLKKYFSEAEERALGYVGLGFHGMVPRLDEPSSYRNRMVALNDRYGFVACLAILEEVNLEKGTMKLYSPPFDRSRVASIQFGSIRLERSGRELPP